MNLFPRLCIYLKTSKVLEISKQFITSTYINYFESFLISDIRLLLPLMSVENSAIVFRMSFPVCLPFKLENILDNWRIHWWQRDFQVAYLVAMQASCPVQDMSWQEVLSFTITCAVFPHFPAPLPLPQSWIEPRTLCMLGKNSTTELHPQPRTNIVLILGIKCRSSYLLRKCSTIELHPQLRSSSSFSPIFLSQRGKNWKPSKLNDFPNIPYSKVVTQQRASNPPLMPGLV